MCGACAFREDQYPGGSTSSPAQVPRILAQVVPSASPASPQRVGCACRPADLAHTQAEYAARLKQDYIRRGLILDDGGDLGSGGCFESGHLGYLEGIILCGPGTPESAMAARELVDTGVRDAIDRAMGVPIAAFGVEANRVFGPACGNYQVWLARIKAALDPYGASDPFFYAEPLRDKEDQARTG
jgi:hypothetical protein